MRRKRKDERQQWTYCVYKFGASLRKQSPPQKWPEPLRQVVFAQQDLWNACQTAWENNRAAYEALLQQAATLLPLRTAHDAAMAQWQEVKVRLKSQRQATQKRAYVGWEEDQAALTSARAALRATRETLKAAEAAYRQHIRPQLTALLDALWQEVYDLGQASPLAWYNERQITDSFRTCVERFLKRQGGPPKPKRRCTSAHLTYHFTGPPLTWEQLLLGKSSMITFGDARAVMPIDPWVWDESQPQHPRRRACRTTGHLRISDTDTLTFSVTLQRRPPEGALIKGVALVGREQSRGWRQHLPLWAWTLCVLCEIPPVDEGRRSDENRRGDKTRDDDIATSPSADASLDLNWRILDDDRIRVGMVYDGTDCTPLYFPAKLVQRWRFCQDLQTALAAQLKSCKASLVTLWQRDPLPPDLDPRGAGWVQTGQGGLLRLLRAVEALPPALSSRRPTLDVLERWAQRTGTLWREWRGLMNHLDRAKTAWYSVTAKQLCTQYRQIAVEALDLQRMAEAEDQLPRLKASQQYRHLVGLGAFLTRLAQTAQREGVTLVKMDPAYTTLECATCGARLAKEDNTGEVYLTCPHGHRYDQDKNSSINLYQRAFKERQLVQAHTDR